MDSASDDLHDYIIRSVSSMEVFADADKSFVIGEWKAWRNACYIEGRAIPPDEFKAVSKEQRRRYDCTYKFKVKPTHDS